MLVMHPSLLPHYRGGCPIQHAILNREVVTGASIIEISKGVFDAGDILYQGRVKVDPENTKYKDLSEELAVLGGKGLYEILHDGAESLAGYRRGKIS